VPAVVPAAYQRVTQHVGTVVSTPANGFTAAATKIATASVMSGLSQQVANNPFLPMSLFKVSMDTGEKIDVAHDASSGEFLVASHAQVTRVSPERLVEYGEEQCLEKAVELNRKKAQKLVDPFTHTRLL